MKNLNNLNKYRVENPIAKLLGIELKLSEEEMSKCGCFKIAIDNEEYNVIASSDLGWEHVSVSHADHIPSWEVMCKIKDLFWEDEDVVMQLHPKKSEYVNLCKTCLHLWKPIGSDIPAPPKELLGF